VGFQQAAQTREQIEGRFGEPGDFVPWPDGVVPAERIETFLTVRDDSMAARTDLAAAVERLMDHARALDEDGSGWNKFKSVFGVIGDSMGMAGEMGVFLTARNDALFQHEMGHGEYFYLYAVGFYSYLGHRAGESSLESLGDVDVSTRGRSSTNIQIDGGGHGANPFLQDQLIEMLVNARKASEEGTEWHALLVAEIEALKSDRSRMPWGSELPEATAASFEPYRDRLTGSWVGAADDFETMRVEDNGDFNFQSAP
ncbi:MAG: hypothetical protein OER88_08710, partial [Planctomycetota bacterium]|nr:hypothetical protein [Planctomycetota bacterium]